MPAEVRPNVPSYASRAQRCLRQTKSARRGVNHRISMQPCLQASRFDRPDGALALVSGKLVTKSIVSARRAPINRSGEATRRLEENTTRLERAEALFA